MNNNNSNVRSNNPFSNLIEEEKATLKQIKNTEFPAQHPFEGGFHSDEDDSDDQWQLRDKKKKKKGKKKPPS
jgi:hypothetical protein